MNCNGVNSRAPSKPVQVPKEIKNINKNVDKYEIQKMIEAVKRGSISQVKKQLSKGVHIETRDKDDLTLLGIAADHRDWPMIKFLISKRADPNQRQQRRRVIICGDSEIISGAGSSVLGRSMCNRDYALMKYLLKNKASTEIRDIYDQTVLMLAVVRGDIRAIRLLLLHKADKKAQKKDGTKVIELAYPRINYTLGPKYCYPSEEDNKHYAEIRNLLR